jgi:hypothetical protein
MARIVAVANDDPALTQWARTVDWKSLSPLTKTGVDSDGNQYTLAVINSTRRLRRIAGLVLGAGAACVQGGSWVGLRRCVPPRPRCRPPQVPPDQWVPSANEGWRPYLTATPQRDLVLQFRRAYTPDKPFTAVPADLPPEFNLTNLYWRLTGIAKAQLIA